MSWVSENLSTARDKSWAWFEQHAHSKHALIWLAIIAYTDAIFSPIVPEAFLAVLMLVRPDRWKQYLATVIVSTTLGAATAYCIGAFLFNTFGATVISALHLGPSFVHAQQLIRGHVFFALALASFTPLPDKVFTYSAGFLGAHFLPFIAGYILGRGTRMAVIAYVVGRYGRGVIQIVNQYFLYIAIFTVALFTSYAIVHWHVLPRRAHVERFQPATLNVSTSTTLQR